MRSTRRCPTRLREDSGATLIFALILITVVAIVVGSLLSFADTSIRVTIASRSEATTAYSADAAAQAAINQLRLGSYNNNSSSPTYPKCFGSGATADTLALNSFYPGATGTAASSAAVTCAPDPNTGAGGGLVPITASNKPGNAILTLGTNPGEDGLNVKALSSSPFVVHGSVVSDSNINVSSGSLQSNAGVYAHTGCTGTITSTPAPACSSGTAADPAYPFDPAYGSPANAVPVYRPVPSVVSASCPGKVVTFAPGYYDDAAGLSALMAGGGSNPCRGSVWWFQPGTYYFDFHNTSDPLLSGADLWTIKDGQLVAGTPTAASGAVLATPASPSTIPGACQNPIKSVSATGVQFIFGGDSQLQMTGSADAEICGTYHSGRPPIAFYGVTTGSDTPTPAPSLTSMSASATSSGGSGFVPPTGGTLTTGVASTDNVYDTWTKTGNSSQSATLTLTGFATTQTVPAGSVLTAAALRVVYGASAAAAARQVVLTPTAAGSSAVTVPLSKTAQAAGATQTFPLLNTSLSGLAASIHSYGYTGASIAYTATTSTAGTENIDAVYLDLTYTAPAFRAEDYSISGGNCLTATYTGGSSGQCAVLSTATSYKGAFYIQGTTYTPKAVIDLTLSNITSQVLRFGVISRALWITETGAFSYVGPVIEVPDNSPGFGPGGTVVYLTVYVCTAAPSCSTSTGSPRLRVRAYLVDPSGTPSPPSRQITVQSWALQR